jgi:lipoate-protein ligase A
MTTSGLRTKVKVSWLDLRGSGLSAIERLALEEVLLRHDARCWAILGTHEPVENRYLRKVQLPTHVANCNDRNQSCVIVMGIGGKPKDLVNMDLVKKDGVLVLKRFSGGGTVVLDHSSLWTTLIGRSDKFVDIEPYPRPIMEWSANKVFGPAFAILKQKALLHHAAFVTSTYPTMIVDTKSCGTENSGRTVQLPTALQSKIVEFPEFSLRENDYVLGQRKMGGNAQSIVKGGWLHHTSFLWDYVDEHMEYLSLPSKRPEYRGDRKHEDFLVKLKTHYGPLRTIGFFAAVKQACVDEFDVEEVTLREAMKIVDDQFGSLQEWYDGKCRTKIVEL